MLNIMMKYWDENGINVLERNLKRLMIMKEIEIMVYIINGKKKWWIRRDML
jgi:hypothetical protein